MTDMDGVLKIKVLRHCREIVSIMVHVMAVASLGRAPVAAPVMRDHTIALIEEEQHLRIPIVCRKWPAVTKHNWLALAPILVINLRPIFYRDHVHRILL